MYINLFVWFISSRACITHVQNTSKNIWQIYFDSFYYLMLHIIFIIATTFTVWLVSASSRGRVRPDDWAKPCHHGNGSADVCFQFQQYEHRRAGHRDWIHDGSADDQLLDNIPISNSELDSVAHCERGWRRFKKRILDKKGGSRNRQRSLFFDDN